MTVSIYIYCNWCNTALKKQSPAPLTSSAFIPKWCNLSSKMFIAGGLTLHLFSDTLIDLGSTPHQQMDLTVDPVYRRLYKCINVLKLTPFGSDAQCHQMSTSEDIDLKLRKYRTPKTSTRYRTRFIRPISKGLWKLREVITASYKFWTPSTNLKQCRYPRKRAASYNFWSIRTSLIQCR